LKFLPYIVRYLFILALGFSFFLLGVAFLFNDTGASTFSLLKVFWWIIPIIFAFGINEYLLKKGLLRSVNGLRKYGLSVLGIAFLIISYFLYH
jgi:ABC-type polysaccharide/polyol phosphate export permease